MDTFMYGNPDFLIVKSAGNDGPASATISSPGTAKNVISIGGT